MATRGHTASSSWADDCDSQTKRLLAEASSLKHPQRRRALVDQAVVLNRGLALALARRYHGLGVDDEDLDQVAVLGLCKAVRGYRPDLGPSFAAFAVPTITGELKRYFRDHGWLVRPTRQLQEMCIAVRALSPQLAQDLGRWPSSADCAVALGVGRADVEEARLADANFHGQSLEAPSDSGGLPLEETLGRPPHELDAVDAFVSLYPAIDELTDRDKLILSLRFVEGQTQEQIGRAIGLSQMQVSRLLSQILHKLRAELVSIPESA